jgi:hypothetical protein
LEQVSATGWWWWTDDDDDDDDDITLASIHKTNSPTIIPLYRMILEAIPKCWEPRNQR